MVGTPEPGDIPMYLRTTTALAVLVFAGCISTSAFAAGECSKIPDAKKRDACIEAKIDKLAAAAPGDTQKAIASWMDGVKIQFKKRPGVCMWVADDWNNNPDTPKETVRTALGCGNENYVFTIRK